MHTYIIMNTYTGEVETVATIMPLALGIHIHWMDYLWEVKEELK